MKILLADDAEVVRLMIGRFIESLGHQLLLANDGAEAVERCLIDRPDMVLMDILMPHMDGCEASRRIKRAMGSQWVPVVLVTAVEEVAKLADAMEAGADDYLIKPVNFRILEAKIKAIERTVELHRKVREQSATLAEYYARAEEEKRVARHLMEQLVSRERLSDAQLHCWISPAASLSGDLIAAARTPGHVLHLMLADGIGHGLTAALNVLPLTHPFYTMSERGFALADILIEMNTKVRQVLPVGRFVAVAFVSVDFANRQIEVWNGGIPDIRLFDGRGGLLKRWKSRHLPLGILSPGQFDSEIERFVYTDRANLVMCSDGLLEARNAAGETFGAARLGLACASVTAERALQQTVEGLSDFMGGMSCHDDVSLAIVDVDPGIALPMPVPSQQTVPMPALVGEASWRYSLSLGVNELRSLQVVPLIMGFISQVKPLAKDSADIFLILTELFVNALDHGVLALSSEMKAAHGGMERYLLERVTRLAELKEGRIEIELAGFDLGGRKVLRVRVNDSGRGFDHAQLSATGSDGVGGRGITLVRSLVGSLQFLGNGNKVEAWYLPRAEK